MNSIVKLTLLKAGVAIILGLTAISSAYSMPFLMGVNLSQADSNPLRMFGTNAAGSNPANLLSPYNPPRMVLFPSIGLSLGNNTFSQSYLTDRFVEGDTLSDADKKDILNRINLNDLNLHGNLSLPGFGYAENEYAFNFATLHVHAEVSLPADLFRLPLRGWVTDRTYEFNDIDAEALAYWSTTFSMARSLPDNEYITEFTAGASFSYFIGMQYLGLGERHGHWRVTADSIDTDGHFQLLSSAHGDGVGLDIGLAGKILEEEINVGLTLGNIIGTLNWQDVEVKDIQFEKHGAVDLDSLIKPSYWKRFFNSEDSTYNYGSYSTVLPKYLILAAEQRQAFGKDNLDLSVSYRQGLNRVTGNSMIPRLAVGGEFRLNPRYPLRAGLSVGGIEGFQISGGGGLNFGSYLLDIGASWQRGLLFGAKGFSFSITNQLVLPVKPNNKKG